MRFFEKTDCKPSVSTANGSVNGLNTYKIKSIFPLPLHFSADSSRCSWMLLSNLL